MPRALAWVAALGLCAALGSCGGGTGRGSGAPSGDRLGASQSAATIAPVECNRVFLEGHNRETTGIAATPAFLPTLTACATLRDWVAASRLHDVDLAGREADFVYDLCQAADARTRTRPICVEATARTVEPTGTS